MNIQKKGERNRGCDEKENLQLGGGKTAEEAVGLLGAGLGRGDPFVSFSLEVLQQPLSGSAAARSQHLTQISERTKPSAMVTTPQAKRGLASLGMPELREESCAPKKAI